MGVLLILISVFSCSKATPFPSLFALVPTFGTMLIILFATQSTTVGRFVGKKAFVGIGLISYSAYLWHQPLFSFARHISLAEPNYFDSVVISGITFVLAYFTWRYVEGPFRARGTFSRRHVFIFAIIGSMSFMVFGYVGYMNGGFISRTERVFSGDIGHLEFHQYIDQKYFDCEPRSVANKALSWTDYLRCKQSKQGYPDTMLLGDSHAEHLFLGLAENKPDNNIAFYIFTGKPYLSNPDYKIVFGELLQNGKPQNVILAMFYVGGDASDLYEGFASTIMAQKNSGKTIFLVGDVPLFSKDPGYCIYKLPSISSPLSCEISIDDVENQRHVYKSILQKLSADYDLRYTDIDAPLCSKARCSMTNGESFLYRGRSHLNILGSNLMGKYLADKLPF